MSRSLNSAKNLIAGLGITLIMTLVGFFTRKIFVDTIGVEYLGLNGLLSNILGMMTLLEGGFGASVVYNLYKPVAEDNKPEILALLQLYRKVYRYFAFGAFGFGLAIFPFIGYFIEDVGNLEYLRVVYFIFLFNSLIQYFTAYKWSLINVNQKNYKLATINLTYQLVQSFSKIAVLYYTKNYILYLLVESACGIILNIAIVNKANKMFPYVINAPKYQVKPETKRNIITNMKALFLHSLGGYFMHSTDNIVMSASIGVAVVGLYSNYTLVISAISSFTSQILNSYSESVGNLIASEDAKNTYNVFKVLFFINFLAVSIPVIVLSVALQPLILWWLGSDYVLSNATLAVILFNFYINGMRSSSFTFKTKAGIFIQDKFTPLIQGVINFVLSLIFVKIWGLTGVLLATGISVLSIGFWQWPRLIYKHVFHKSLSSYFKTYFFYTLIAAFVLLISFIICNNINVHSLFLRIFINVLVSIMISIIFYCMFFRGRYEFIQLKNYTKFIIDRIRNN